MRDATGYGRLRVPTSGDPDAMPETVNFIAYPSHASLRRDVEELITRIDGGTRESQKALAARAFETAAKEVVDVMIRQLVDRLQNPARPNVELHRSLDRLDEHLGGFARMLAGMLNNDRIRAALGHYRTLLLDIDDATGTPQPWIGFRVDDDFVAELHAVCAHLRDEQAQYDARRTMRMLDRLTDAILHQLVEEPKDRMQFNFLVRKTVDGAIAVIRSALHTMMHRSIPHLSARQRAGLADHFGSVLHALPADRYA